MTLIPDWKRAWRYLSVQAAMTLAVLSFLQAEILPLFQFAVPPTWWPWVTAGFGAAIAVLRVVAQPGAAAAADAPPAATKGAP